MHGRAFPEQSTEQRRDKTAEHEVERQREQDACLRDAGGNEDAGEHERHHADAHPTQLRVLAVDVRVAAEAGQVAHNHVGHAEDRARRRGERRGDDAREHDDRDDRGGVLGEKDVEQGVLASLKPEGLHTGERDHAVQRADEGYQNRSDEAGVARNLGILRAVNALLEVDGHDVAHTERKQRRPVDGGAGFRGSQLLEIERSKTLGNGEAVRDADKHGNHNRGNEGNRSLDCRCVRIGEQASAKRVEQDKPSRNEQACHIRQTEKVLE